MPTGVGHRMRRLIALVVVGVVLAACAADPIDTPTTTTAPDPSQTTTTTAPTDGQTAELEAAKARWAGQGLATYQFVLTDDCGECSPDMAAPTAIVVWEGTAYDPRQRGVTIDALFTVIESAVASGQTVEVTYHPDLGYPTEIWIDREARAYDGGTHLLVDLVQPGLPGVAVTSAEMDAAMIRWQENRPAAYEYRTDIACGCPLESTQWTLVDGDRIVDWKIEHSLEPTPPDISPVTIDGLLDDLRFLVTEGEVVEGGARITGTATFHPELGYPEWVGLDIEILDPEGELGDLPPRLVFAVRDVTAHDLTSSAHARAVEQWNTVGPDTYSYELTVHDVEDGSFEAAYLVEVEDDIVVMVTRDGNAIEVEGIPALPVERLFALIDGWIADNWEVDVIYDQRLGHPVVVTAHDGANEVVAFSIAALMPR